MAFIPTLGAGAIGKLLGVPANLVTVSIRLVFYFIVFYFCQLLLHTLGAYDLLLTFKPYILYTFRYFFEFVTIQNTDYFLSLIIVFATFRVFMVLLYNSIKN
jgi:hypothetical protein